VSDRARLTGADAVGHRRVRLVIAYDGSRFHGFAENVGVDTVAGALRTAIERAVRRPVTLVGAGRTDAGVHASGQVVSTDVPADVDLTRFVRRVNAQVAPSIVVRGAQWVEHDFDARFDALWRHYRYRILAQPEADPFLAATTWHVTAELSLSAMRLASDAIVGEHDFSSFCRRPRSAPDEAPVSLVRRVILAEWHPVDDDGRRLLHFDIRATAFCHQMVRSIVGTLVDVGIGRLSAGDMLSVLGRRDRAAAGRVAPPHGLCLREVGYPGEGESRRRR
jgi:tRNA pseudouridine38-40 synthase